MACNNIRQIIRGKGQDKLICLTAYDAFSARISQTNEVDMVLVGDSLGFVVQGDITTVPVTLEQIIYHTKIVVNNTSGKVVIADMPFGSYGITVESTVKNCMEVIKATGATAVKMEGTSEEILEAIYQLVNLGVPVMGHIGFQPQSVNVSGVKIAGKTEEDVESLMERAMDLTEAGVFSLVLESVIESAARRITESITIPTIGIGSGKYTDGQVLVFHDLVGMTTGYVPTFVRQYANITEVCDEAVAKWVDDVKAMEFPSEKETYQVK